MVLKEVRGLHRANSNTDPNSVKVPRDEEEIEPGQFDAGNNNDSQSCMNQVAGQQTLLFLHHEGRGARNWAPTEPQLSENEYSPSISPALSLTPPTMTPSNRFAAGLPQEIFIQMMQNLSSKDLSCLPYWIEAERMMATFKLYNTAYFTEAVLHTTISKWRNAPPEEKAELKNGVVHGTGLGQIVKETIHAIRAHPERFDNKRKLEIAYDLLQIGYSLKKSDIADLINLCHYEESNIVPLEEVILFCKTNFSHFLVREIKPELKMTMINSAACWLGASTYPFTWPEYDLILLTKTLGDYICCEEFRHIGLERTIPEIFLSIDISFDKKHPDGRLLTIHWLDAFHRVFGKRAEDHELFKQIVIRCAIVLHAADFNNFTQKDWSCIIRACGRFSGERVVHDLLFKLAKCIPDYNPHVRDILHNFVKLDRAEVKSRILRNYVAASLTKLGNHNKLVLCECKSTLGHVRSCYGVKKNELLDAMDIIITSEGFVSKTVMDFCRNLSRSRSQSRASVVSW